MRELGNWGVSYLDWLKSSAPMGEPLTVFAPDERQARCPTCGKRMATPRESRDAECKAAAKLGITPEQLRAAAQTCWGRSLIEERDARTPADASAARRGHVTRRLIAELDVTRR